MELQVTPYMKALFINLLAMDGIEPHNLRVGLISDVAQVGAATEYNFNFTKSGDNTDAAATRKIPTSGIFVAAGYRVLVANVKKDASDAYLLTGANWQQSVKMLMENAIFDNTASANELTLLEEVGQFFKASIKVLDEDDNIVNPDMPTSLVEQMININGIEHYADYMPILNPYVLYGKYANPSIISLPNSAKTAKMAAVTDSGIFVMVEQIGYWVENLCDVENGPTAQEIKNNLLSVPKSCTVTQSNLTETSDCGCEKVEMTTTIEDRYTAKYGII
ncbi:MAG: hypothetical protein AAGJ18_21580 [Bacteroidota bacterium]